MKPVRAFALGAIRLYQILSPALPRGHCRHWPTCSDYARQAIERHGVWRGTRLALARLGRCHPLGTAGYDPVP